MPQRIPELVKIIILLALCSLSATPVDAFEKNINKPLKIGVASMITPVSAVRYYQQIVDYLADKLHIPAEMVHRTTYDEIDILLKQKQLDVAFICSAPYVHDKEDFGVELLVAPMVDGSTSYQSLLIVHKNSPFQTFEDLAGKTFAFVDPKSNSGRLYPIYWLARHGTAPNKFFSRFFFSYSHNKSVEMVAKKKADAASVDSAVYAFMIANNSPYASQTRIIHRSPDFGIPPVVVPPDYPPSLKKKIRDIFLGMHNDPAGRKILSGMRIDRFVVVLDSSYDPIRKMIDFLKNNRAVNDNPQLQPLSQNEKNQPVRFGVIPRDNPRIAYEKYQPLLDYLAKQTGYKLELLLKTTYEETVKSLGAGEMDLALLGPLTYLDAYSRYGTPPIVKSITSEGEPFYHTVIVSVSGKTIQKISDLTAKKMAFASLWSTSGNLIPRYMLAWAGIHLDKLDTYTNFNYHDTVVKKVLSHEYDAGGIRRSVARRYLKFGLNIIATSNPIPTGPIVVSPDTSYAVVKKIQKALLDIDKTESGRHALSQLDPDLQGGFVPASDADYSGIRKMINDVPQSCGIKCHPRTTY